MSNYNFVDLTGRIFGRLIVIKQNGTDKKGHALWLCKCNCGQEKEITSNSLVCNLTKSCGCLRKEKLTTHGHSKTKIYKIWTSMIQRCINTKYKEYKNYGGRGIKVCKRWLKFENFLEDVGEKPTGLSLDRIDNNGNYCLENHRWATKIEQARNMRKNINIVFNNENKCISAFAYEYKINRRTLKSRIDNGWPIEKVLNTPVRKSK